jgi:uncharacterized protein
MSSTPHAQHAGAQMRLASVHVYPIKSCAGLTLDHAKVTAHGLQYDRRWMVIDAQGCFVTGRQHGRMALIRVEPDGDALRLDAPGMPSLHVPTPADAAPRAMVTVWKDYVDATYVGTEADAWLSAYLGQPVRLVYFDAKSRRAVNAKYARSDDEVAFADGYPLLAISQSALDALNARIRDKSAAASEHEAASESSAAAPPFSIEPLSMARFRPNLVIAGAEPHAEDAWRSVRIGEVLFDAVKPCTRCVFTTVDPDTGERHPEGEPLNTLKDYRRTPAGIIFGMNLIPRGRGVLRLGDAIEVIA